MTIGHTGPQSLPLQGSPRKIRGWMLALACGFPAAMLLGNFAVMAAHGAADRKLVLLTALALGIVGLATFWIERALKRIGVTLEGEALQVDTGLVSRRFALSTLRAGGLRVVNLAEHVELRPMLRTFGIGMPGLASGWFRLRNRDKALCILTEREKVTALRADDGIWVLLSLADPGPLRAAIERR